jgi:heme/copper-type cytochrome/quinol oxidase subunit 4
MYVYLCLMKCSLRLVCFVHILDKDEEIDIMSFIYLLFNP